MSAQARVYPEGLSPSDISVILSPIALFQRLEPINPSTLVESKRLSPLYKVILPGLDRLSRIAPHYRDICPIHS